MSIEGIGLPGAQWCGVCQRYHEPSTAVCQRQGGHIEFAPYPTPRLPGAAPIDFRQFETPPIMQRLDRIIEQLEFICNELRRNSGE